MSKFEIINRILYASFCIVVILIIWIPCWLFEKLIETGCLLVGYKLKETKIGKWWDKTLYDFLIWLTMPIS